MKALVLNLSVDIIHHHDDDEPGGHETVAMDCFAHIPRSPNNVLYFDDEDISARCTSFSSDNEAEAAAGLSCAVEKLL